MSPKNLTSKNPFFFAQKTGNIAKVEFQNISFFSIFNIFFEKGNSKEADQKT